MVNLLKFRQKAEYSDGRAAGLAGQLNIETADAAGVWLQPASG